MAYLKKGIPQKKKKIPGGYIWVPEQQFRHKIKKDKPKGFVPPKKNKIYRDNVIFMKELNTFLETYDYHYLKVYYRELYDPWFITNLEYDLSRSRLLSGFKAWMKYT